VTLLVGAAAAAAVAVAASPGTVPGTGGTSVVTATVLDADNNALPGVPVSFATDLGTLSPVSATTDQTGQASSTLTTYQTSTITVTAGPKITGTAKVTASAAPVVSIGAPASTPTAGQSTSFTVNVAAGSGGAPITKATVNFGDGSPVFNLGAANGAVPVSHTYKEEDTYTVTASATDASIQTTSTSVPLTVFPAVPFTLTVSAPSGKSGVALTIAATPGAGAPTVTKYVWNFGDGTTAQTDVPAAPHTYTLPAGTTTPQQFIITVTATGADGRTGFGSTFVTITP
jgi:adhesin/invasin